MVGTTTHKTVTIEKRGAFHDDAFFKDSWDSWDKAMKDVVTRWDSDTQGAISTVPQGNETHSVYRKIRSSNVTSDKSQAVSCTEEDDKYKVVIDVKDFKPEDINVKTVDDTVVVEGKVEKKEGNSISTQKFVRRFLLPPGINLNCISSALSKDGVLTINAPKLAIKSSANSGRSVPVKREIVSTKKTSYGSLPAAGKPSQNDSTSHISRAGTNTTHLMTEREKTPKRNYINFPPAGKPTYTPTSPTYSTTGTDGSSKSYFDGNTSSNTPTRYLTTVEVPDRRDSESLMSQDMISASNNHWGNFDTMVERSQKEMEDMMKRHTLHTSLDTPPSIPKVTFPSSNSAIAVPNNGVNSSRNISRDGNKVTEREEHRWDDKPVPGLNRSNRAKTEVSTVRNASGDIIGTSDKKQQHSHAEGGHEETLPDGSKMRTFTKSYETKNSYSANSNNAKAL